MALSNLFQPCVDSLFYLFIKVIRSATIHVSFLYNVSSLQDFILALQLLLDSQEARVNLSLKVFDRLIRVSWEQTLCLLLLCLDDKQILVAEGALTKFELEHGLWGVYEGCWLDELSCTFGWSQVLLRLRRCNVLEAIEGELGHDLILTLGLDAHILIIDEFDHWDSDIKHDVCEEHRRGHEKEPEEKLISIFEPTCVWLANRDIEDEKYLLAVAYLSSCEGVERRSKTEDEAEEYEEEESHLVHHIENQAYQVTNFSEVSQEVE